MLRWLRNLLHPSTPARADDTTTHEAPPPATARPSAPMQPIAISMQPAQSMMAAWQTPQVSVTVGQPTATHTPQPLRVLETVLREEGHVVEYGQDSLQISGLQVSVQLHDVYRDGANQRSVTQTFVTHERFGSKPLIEYQFGAGADTDEALRNGFRLWCQLDLVVLIDALRDTPETCRYMSWDASDVAKPMPDGGERPPHNYRVLFGPIQHFLADPGRLAPDEDPGFCPCCLFTQSFNAFLPLLREGGLIPARLFVARDANGEATADCRINGEEYPPVQKSLKHWVEKWQDRGFEWRKQYVLAVPI